MNKRNEARKTITYKVKTFIYKITKKDVEKAVTKLYEDIVALLGLAAILAIIFFVPHLFH